MKRGFFVLSAVIAGTAGAQSEIRHDPAAPNAPVPRLEYRSAFEDFRRLPDEQVGSWRAANEAVKEKKTEEKKTEEKKPDGEHRGGHR